MDKNNEDSKKDTPHKGLPASDTPHTRANQTALPDDKAKVAIPNKKPFNLL